MNHAQLKRIRWAVRATLILGVAASVTANVLHARQNPIAQSIAAWPPLALLLTVELISRVPVHRRGLAAVRVGATAVIAGIAAWVSYWHMAGVAARYGEEPAAAHLIPLSVDGLVVVASVCLVELAGRLRDVGAVKISPMVAPLATPTPTHAATAPSGAEVPPELPPSIAEASQVNAPTPADPLPPELPAPVAAAPSGDDPSAKVKKAAGTSAPRRPFVVTQRAAAALQSDGMEVPEIAEALGISERQVRNALKPVPVGARPGSVSAP